MSCCEKQHKHYGLIFESFYIPFMHFVHLTKHFVEWVNHDERMTNPVDWPIVQLISEIENFMVTVLPFYLMSVNVLVRATGKEYFINLSQGM